jgi:putative ABC transport system permease protein
MTQTPPPDTAPSAAGRALLSALGIAIGIAALVAVLGITRSSQSALLAEIDQLGTSLLTVTTGQTLPGQETELPAHATAMIRRIAGVEQAAPTAILSTARVYRTGAVPVYDTGGLAVRAADPSLLAVLGAAVRQGTFLNTATSRYPVTVLGYQAAQTLGISSITSAGPPPRVLIGGQWFTVTGILFALSECALKVVRQCECCGHALHQRQLIARQALVFRRRVHHWGPPEYA